MKHSGHPVTTFVLSGGASHGAIQAGMLEALYERGIAPDVIEEVGLSHGPLREGILASSAIPGVLPTVRWQGRELMDGGVTNNIPVSHAAAFGARRIYVLTAGSACELDEPPRGAVAMLVYATGLLIGHRLTADLAALSADIEVCVLPPPCPLTIQPTDFGHADDLITLGRDSARRWLSHQDRHTGRRRSASPHGTPLRGRRR